jgi:hypothetical protein
MTPSNARSASRRATIAVLAAAWALSVPHPGVRGQAGPRLATVLSDLATAVPQELSAVPLAAPGAVATNTLPRSVRDAVRSRRLRIDPTGGVQVYILVTEVNDEVVEALEASGVRIEIPDPAERRIQARVAAARLLRIAELPFVTFVRLPNYAVHRAGAFTTEGDEILKADQVRDKLDVDGAGVRVAVISDGLKGVFAGSCTTCGGAGGGPIASGDLPDASGTRTAAGVLTSSSGGITGRSFQADSDLEGLPSGQCAFDGAGAEGTALLEIVHDLAPGAQLSFANADTDLAFNQAVSAMAAANDVVVDDLGFFGMPSDGTSTISSNTAAALNNDSNPIRAYVTSNGNSADEHYYGTYSDSGVDGTSVSGIATPGHLHRFQKSGDTTDVLGLGAQPYNVVALPTNGEIVIFLTWDDPTGGSRNNYDLYLVQEGTGRVVARSVDTQSGSQDPVEALDYVNAGARDRFHIVVQNVQDQAQARNLNLFSFQPECASDGPLLLAAGHHERHNYNTATRSMAAQGDAGGSPDSVISVGAICSASPAAQGVFNGSPAPDESCKDTKHSTIEFFSSLGPTLDGRTKPDVSGIDGVSVSGAGSFPKLFFGTSAAGPHLAATAALVLESAPCLLDAGTGALSPASARGKVRNLLLNNAVKLGVGLPNNTFGYGRADALSSVQHTLPGFSGGSTVTVSGNTPTGAAVSGAALGFSDPNSCPIKELSWSGGCGAGPAPSLSCPFGTTSVKVSGSNNGRSYSSTHEVKITVTNFTLGASPAAATVAAGDIATYTVKASAQGGAFTAPITLSCGNLPTQAVCTFSPATLTPGSGSAQSTLTISTGTKAAAPAVPGVLGGSPQLRSVLGDCPPWVLSLALILLMLALGRRPTTSRAAGLCAATLGLMLLQACGGSSGSNGGGGGGGGGSGSVTLSPSSLTFGTTNLHETSAAQNVTLTNSTSAALAITSIVASGDFAQTNTCGTSVATNGSCSIGVTFTPTSGGARSGSIVITDSGAGSPRTVTLTGTGQVGTTPPGTYNIGVSGASGTLVKAGSVALTVQ